MQAPSLPHVYTFSFNPLIPSPPPSFPPSLVQKSQSRLPRLVRAQLHLPLCRLWHLVGLPRHCLCIRCDCRRQSGHQFRVACAGDPQSFPVGSYAHAFFGRVCVFVHLGRAGTTHKGATEFKSRRRWGQAGREVNNSSSSNTSTNSRVVKEWSTGALTTETTAAGACELPATACRARDALMCFPCGEKAQSGEWKEGEEGR